MASSHFKASPRCKFETQFAPVYQRNNKAKSKGKEGMKNIRCFPDHGVGGHVEKGFCGSTASFLCQDDPSGKPLRAWAQFELGDGSNRACKPGDILSLKSITEELERNRFALGRPWFPTTQARIDESKIRFTINSERWGWNYSWVSNVHTCDLTHCLCIYLFRELDEDRLVCIEVHPSTEFQVFCSRRRRTPSSPTSRSLSSSPLTLGDSGTEEDRASSKRIRQCATDWKEASELTAASLLLLVRSGIPQLTYGTS